MLQLHTPWEKAVLARSGGKSVKVPVLKFIPFAGAVWFGSTRAFWRSVCTTDAVESCMLGTPDIVIILPC